MALDDIKKQVVSMLQSVMTLNGQDRSEVLGFLNNCAENYGLRVPKIDEPEVAPAETDSLPSVAVMEELVTTAMTDLSNIAVPEQSSPTDLSTTRVEPCEQQLYVEPKPVYKRNRRKEIFAKPKAKRKHVSIEKEKLVPKEVDTKEGTKKLKNSGKSEEVTVLKCPGCASVHSNKAELMVHLKTHTNAPMSCRMCKYFFSSCLQFWKHQKNGKCKMAQLVCAECGEKFKYRRHYLKHIVGHGDNNCQYCEHKFSTWPLYKEHLKKNHPSVKLERDLIPCKFCPMSFRKHFGLYNHYRVKHSKRKFVCLSCGVLLPTKEKHKEHMLGHEAEKHWNCNICNMKFYRRQQLLVHVSNHQLGLYKCLTCNITVTAKTELAKHKKQGHEVTGLEPKLKCEKCGKRFDKTSRLNDHMTTHTNQKQYCCKHCVKYFSSLEALMKHEKRRTHLEKAQPVVPESKYEKIYEDKLVCESCGKQYKTKLELQWHLRVHKAVYKCEKCEKTFTIKVNLTRHMKLHGKKVPLICEVCGDSFSSLCALQEHHKMKHEDARPERCLECSKTFKRKSELNRHMRTHDMKRAFVCYCGQSYKQSAHLRSHQRTAHGKPIKENVPSQETPDTNANYANAQQEMYNPDLMFHPERPERRPAKSDFVAGVNVSLLALGTLGDEDNYEIHQLQPDPMDRLQLQHGIHGLELQDDPMQVDQLHRLTSDSLRLPDDDLQHLHRLEAGIHRLSDLPRLSDDLPRLSDDLPRLPDDVMHRLPDEALHSGLANNGTHRLTDETLHPLPDEALHPLPNGSLSHLTDSALHGIPHDIHRLSDSSLHRLADNGDIHRLTDNNIHRLSDNSDIHRLPDNNIHRLSDNSDIHRLADTSMHRLSDNGDLHRLTDNSIHRLASDHIHRLTDPNLHALPDDTMHRLSDDGMHRLAGDGMRRIHDDGIDMHSASVPYVSGDYVPNGIVPMHVTYEDLNFGPLWM